MNCLLVMTRALVADGKTEQARDFLSRSAEFVHSAVESNNVRWVVAYCEALAAVGDTNTSLSVANRLHISLERRFGADDPRTQTAKTLLTSLVSE
jgi:hypothetical protein